MNNWEKTAIIIGAGPAGLTAAYQLCKQTDIKPIILEETEEIGGISRTAQYKGNRMDIGGHRFFSKNQQVVELWKELMPIQGKPSKDDILLKREKPVVSGGPDPEKMDRVLLIRNRVSRIFFLRKFFDYPISIKPATFINMGFIRTVKAGFGYLSVMVHKRKENSLEDFYINRFGKPLYHMFFEDYTEKLWGIHPSNISPDWGAQRVKGLSLSKAIAGVFAKMFRKNYKTKETSLIEQYIYPKKGPGQLWEIMASEIEKMGGTILRNQRVVEAVSDSNRITEIIAVDKEGKKTAYQGEYYMSTMPIKDLTIAMGDVVPKDIYRIATELPYRDFITVGLLLDRMLIKNNTKIPTVDNRVPDCWIYIQERDVRLGRLQIFNNWSPYMVEDFEHNIWIGMEYFCSEGDELWNKSSEEMIAFAIDELCKIDIIEKNAVLDATHIRVKKAYPAYFGTYQEFPKVQKYYDHFQNLFLLGRNGQHRYNNMDHSMLTAMEAVNLIRKGSKDKKILWSVNTEEEYHEQKSEA